MASTHDEPSTTIIKSDRSGRPRYTRAYKDEVLAAYAASGMSGPAFAEHCGVKYPTFAGWVARSRREGDGASGPAAAPRFVLAEVAAEAGGSAGAGGLLVKLPGGAAAEVSTPPQAALLAELIKALA